MKKGYFKFLIPSLLGILILMIPFKYEGSTLIFVGLLSKLMLNYISNYVLTIVYILVNLSAILSIITKLFKPRFIMDNEKLRNMFDLGKFWFSIRILSLIFTNLIFYSVDFKIITSEDTGTLVFNDLIPTLFTIFFFASFLLPLLTEFGLLEYVGILMKKVMRPLFNLPGRSSIDCIASWIGDGTIGVALTSRQYELGYYTEKEAAIISTTFSAVSITFSLVVLEQVGLSQYFGIYYLTIILVAIACGIIIPKIYPLNRKKDKYYTDKPSINEEVEENTNLRNHALDLAIKRAQESYNFKEYIIKGIYCVLDMWLVVIPTVICFGTLGLILKEYTEIFTILGYPFKYIYDIFGVPNSLEASKAVIVGFSDMFIPSIIAQDIPSEMTRFIVATLSITQVIYLSETGAVILGTKIPVNIFDLFIIYIERTLISLPIIILIAKLIF